MALPDRLGGPPTSISAHIGMLDPLDRAFDMRGDDLKRVASEADAKFEVAQRAMRAAFAVKRRFEINAADAGSRTCACRYPTWRVSAIIKPRCSPCAIGTVALAGGPDRSHASWAMRSTIGETTPAPVRAGDLHR